MEPIMPKKCKACGRNFQPDARVADEQKYCSDAECQRKRRQEWQQVKRRDDPHYRENDARQIEEWGARNPDYWKRYRQENPDYATRNRNLQRSRNQQQRNSLIANEDAIPTNSPLSSGRYQLKSISAEGIANEDAWIVEITVLSTP